MQNAFITQPTREHSDCPSNCCGPAPRPSAWLWRRRWPNTRVAFGLCNKRASSWRLRRQICECNPVQFGARVALRLHMFDFSPSPPLPPPSRPHTILSNQQIPPPPPPQLGHQRGAHQSPTVAIELPHPGRPPLKSNNIYLSLSRPPTELNRTEPKKFSSKSRREGTYL